MPEATADDVRLEIDTRLSDEDIEGDPADADDDGLLGRVARDWQREYASSDFEDSQHIADFEATLTALRIATGRDPTASSESLGNWSKEYDADRVQELRVRVRRLDPGEAFGNAPLIRDSDRYSGSVGPNTET